MENSTGWSDECNVSMACNQNGHNYKNKTQIGKKNKTFISWNFFLMSSTSDSQTVQFLHAVVSHVPETTRAAFLNLSFFFFFHSANKPFWNVKLDQTESERGERARETERKRRSNKSKIEKFWPQRKAPSFEVLSSPSERFGPLTHTHTHTHTHAHTHTLWRTA